MEEKICVAIRARPLLDGEKSEGAIGCVRTAENQIVVGGERTFGFDRVFGSHDGNEAVYSEVGKPLMDSFLKGYNATFLAYGQTGAGKTFTMSSIMRSSLAEIFLMPFEKLWVSALEIYNDQLIDLLASRTGKVLQLREGNEHSVTVVGQSVHEVVAYEELMTFVNEAMCNRQTASTRMNAESSRSHCVVCVSRKCATGSSRVTFVDLAGSERIKKAHAQNGSEVRIREGININSGLLALGNVVTALCEGRSHIPFRSSKLTRVLQEGLWGNSRTVMIACVGTGDINFEETLNTLKYADRAKQLSTRPILGSESATFPEEARELIDALRAEIAALQQLPQKDGNYSPSKRIEVLEAELLREKNMTLVLEEDLYRAEHSAMRLSERCKQLEGTLRLAGLSEVAQSSEEVANLIEERDRALAKKIAAEERMAKSLGSQLNAETSAELNEALAANRTLEDEYEETRRKLHALSAALHQTLGEKEQLHQSLLKTEAKLESSSLDRSTKEERRLQLKKTFDARQRAAEIRVMELRKSLNIAEKMKKLQKSKLSGIQSKIQDLEGRKANVEPSTTNLSVRNTSLSKELNRKESELEYARANLIALSSPVMRNLDEIEALSKEISEKKIEKSKIKNEIVQALQCHETVKLKRAVNGWKHHLANLESDIAKQDSTESREHLVKERENTQQKLSLLEEQMPSQYQQLVRDLHLVEETIDSLQAAKNFKLKQYRLQRGEKPKSPAVDVDDLQSKLLQQQRQIEEQVVALQRQADMIRELTS